MKFIHCSDLHLDSPFKSLPLDVAKIRKEEVLSSFERLCKYAKTNCIKAVIIAGDMFDSKKATIKTMDRVFNSIKNCPNVDFLYLSGNHDALTINEDEYVFPDNFKLFQNEWTSFSYENVNIIGAYFDKYNSKTLFDTISLDKTLINILVMHGQIAGYKSNEDAEIISLPKLAEKGVDYLALGHIHEYSIGSIDKRGVYAYSGTLEGRGFDELGKKGFIEISVENCTLNHKFVEFSSRENYQVDFDISSYTNIHDVIEGIKENLTENYGENNLFKVVLKGEHLFDLSIDTDYIVSKLKDCFFFIKVYDNTTLKIDVNDFEYDKSVRGEFVRNVLNSKLSEDDKKDVIMCGLNALKGEEEL